MKMADAGYAQALVQLVGRQSYQAETTEWACKIIRALCLHDSAVCAALLAMPEDAVGILIAAATTPRAAQSNAGALRVLSLLARAEAPGADEAAARVAEDHAVLSVAAWRVADGDGADQAALAPMLALLAHPVSCATPGF
jgi:hypothetical protein